MAGVWFYMKAGLIGAGLRLVLHFHHAYLQREYRVAETPTRADCIKRLKRGEFDVLVIGGGAVGAGVALEAASRGLSCALVEKGDFAGQTSSKSTKLLHGGVRYLEQAIQGQNILENLQLITEALRERSILLRAAPQMNAYVPLVVPVTSAWEFAYYYLGLWTYHMIAKTAGFYSRLTDEIVPAPYGLTRTELKGLFPALHKDFAGGVVYYDGQMNDSRLCLTVLLTALTKNYIEGMESAYAANYCVVEELLSGTGRVCGAKVRDLMTNEVFDVTARVVINCTGPFSDSVRRMARQSVADRIIPAKGSHLIMKGDFCSHGSGLLVPKTSDGRLMFLLPWHGNTLVGTTDAPVALTDHPQMDRSEQDFMLGELAPYLGKSAESLKADVLGSFSGLRPLVKKSSSGSTKELSRSHEIELLSNGLVSVMGGKWTTFRSMAQEAVDLVVERFGLEPRYHSRSEDLLLVGYIHDSEGTVKRLSAKFGLSQETAARLVRDYGNRAEDVLTVAPELNVPLALTYLKSEVVFACRKEYALTPTDVLCRRMRLGLEDSAAAIESVPEVVRLMSAEFQWSEPQRLSITQSSLSELSHYSVYRS